MKACVCHELLKEFLFFIQDFERILIAVIDEFPGKNIFIAIETVYSMDGDVAPLKEMIQILKKYWPNRENGYVIVDEVS
jgi:8-amino-7-oxononanoate synthase